MDLTELLNDPQLISGIAMMQGTPVAQAQGFAENTSAVRARLAMEKRRLALEEEAHDIEKRKQNLELSKAKQAFKINDLRVDMMVRSGLISPEEGQGLKVGEEQGLARSIAQMNGANGLSGRTVPPPTRGLGAGIPFNRLEGPLEAPSQGLAPSVGKSSFIYEMMNRANPQAQRISDRAAFESANQEAPRQVDPVEARRMLALDAMLGGDTKTAAGVLFPKPDTMTPYQAESIRQRELDRQQREQLATTRGAGSGGRAVGPLSYTQLDKAVSGLLGGQPWFEQLRTKEDDPGKLSRAQENFKNRVVTAALSNLRKNPSLPTDEAITTGFEEVYKDVRVRSDEDGNPVFDYSPRLNKIKDSGPSQEDIEYTARKHGITPEEVISRLKAAGKL